MMTLKKIGVLFGILLLLSGTACSGTQRHLQKQASAIAYHEPVWPDFEPIIPGEEDYAFGNSYDYYEDESDPLEVVECARFTESSQVAKCKVDKSFAYLQVQAACYSTEDNAMVEVYLDFEGSNESQSQRFGCIKAGSGQLDAAYDDVHSTLFTDENFLNKGSVKVETAQSTENIHFQIVVYMFKYKK